MQPPTVRTLDQLTTDTNSIYDPQRANINNQIASAGTRLSGDEAGLAAAQTNAFGDITQQAARRGALFSGFTPDQQAHYTAEKYLPALAGLRTANEQTIQGLNNNLLTLNSDQAQKAFDTQNQDISQLYDYNKTQAEHQFQTQQAQTAYQQELEKLRVQAQYDAQSRASSNASQTPSTQQFLVSAFSGYKPAYQGGQAYYTEREVIPALMANYGLNKQQASDLAYGYRKQVFGEGYGNG